MSVTNSVSEILYAKVFTNQHLLENILSYLSNDFRKNLNIRLVNKLINNTFLRLIRRSHRINKNSSSDENRFIRVMDISIG
ncbi:hypothetical protein CRE_02420 [Caenorhabditis remanei]|uniref:Uncharacterized protein n=1 Tax=Caenorhabditis remanei TaxID=31234 RepID=E3MIP4_CAERE|nr:hypothetical protein CRE_02420 [Caenorhabditis remanei]